MRKTKADLENSIRSLIAYSIVITFFMIFFGAMMFVSFNQFNHTNILLEECREQVPVWTLKVNCRLDDNLTRMSYEQDFIDQPTMEYAKMNLLKEIKESEMDCEVIK